MIVRLDNGSRDAEGRFRCAAAPPGSTEGCTWTHTGYRSAAYQHARRKHKADCTIERLPEAVPSRKRTRADDQKRQAAAERKRRERLKKRVSA